MQIYAWIKEGEAQEQEEGKTEQNERNFNLKQNNVRKFSTFVSLF